MLRGLPILVGTIAGFLCVGLGALALQDRRFGTAVVRISGTVDRYASLVAGLFSLALGIFWVGAFGVDWLNYVGTPASVAKW